MKDALGGQNLLSIYSVYEKLKGKSTASTQGPSSAAEGRPSTPSVPQDSEAAKGGPTEESEKLKGQGNAAMQKKDYATAIDFYTKALEVSPLNPIYLSNRAAAYSASQKHDLAKNDAELATVADPKYTKAWSRLGLSRFALGDAKGSMEAYAKGIEAEGNGGSDAMKKGFETAKRLTPPSARRPVARAACPISQRSPACSAVAAEEQVVRAACPTSQRSLACSAAVAAAEEQAVCLISAR
jgi:small glutamine-rich tetratricopeptide repeat-containing protein alpha